MAFESLTDKLQNVFKNLRSKGRLTEEDVKAALKEVKLALLEADVNFKVVKQFVKAVEERAIGSDVMNGLNPGQMVIKIVNEEMISLMGSETTEIQLQPGKSITVIMMCGLQGAGKTTTTAKIAGKLKQKGKTPLLVACDVYRPAAVKQLQINGEKQKAINVLNKAEKEIPEYNVPLNYISGGGDMAKAWQMVGNKQKARIYADKTWKVLCQYVEFSLQLQGNAFISEQQSCLPNFY